MSDRHPLGDYYRCPASVLAPTSHLASSARAGFFNFCDVVCYGRLSAGATSDAVDGHLIDAFADAVFLEDRLRLPFDFAEVVTNLRQEQYHQNGYRALDRMTSSPAADRLYYFFRPLLRVGVRKHLQKIRLSGWERIVFPRWPVDASVDGLMRATMGLVLKQSGVERIPFVWFWPEGARSAAMMTHDVEGPVGEAFCGQLMDLDESYGVKSAFQLIPEGRERIWKTLASRLRDRGFEVNLHDLNHDGHLYNNRGEFLDRASKINQYAREFECTGFRSGAMYREQTWYDAFEFSYDMSVPSVAHLEPQRGGCCTVMPYFVGDILELPLTTVQDYSLFHILGDYSLGLWQRQIDAIREQNGLMTFLAHPDYIAEPRALAVYESLLAHLQRMRDKGELWMALPGDVNRWWRHRHEMRLVPSGESWRIEGPDADRARLAYAELDGDRVRYTVAKE